MFFKMERKKIKLLEKDLNRARKLRNSVDRSNNYEVTDSSYLNPTTSGIVLPLRHPHGSFIYFQKIVKVLEEARTYGFISENPLPANCPRYLEELVA